MKRRVLWLPLLLLVLVRCSDDGDGPSDGVQPADALGMDHVATNDAPADGLTDGNILPWPDGPVYKDTQPLSCTPEQAGMCNDDKTKYCKSGVCTWCPANYVDCDRKDDCECIGACNGTKCVN